MNRYVLLMTLLLFFRIADAQNENAAKAGGGEPFTLEQCIVYALENNISLKNTTLDQEIAKAKVKETRGIGLPQVDASVTVLHNQKLQRMFGPNVDTTIDANAFGFFKNIPGAKHGDIVAAQNFFQQPSAGDAKLNISQIIFNSSYLVGLQAAAAYRDLAIKNADQTREQVVQNVSKAYYGALINNDRIGLFESNIARVDSLLKTTNALFENGFAESIDVDRIKVTLNNLKAELNKFRRLQDLSLQLLKFQMNYPLTQPLRLAGNISEINVDTELLNEYSANWEYDARTDYRLLLANRKLQELNLKNKFAEGLPSLVAFANLGYSTQSQNVSGIFKTNTKISDNGMIGPDKWYPYSSFGVTLNVPLFSGLQRTYRVQQAKIELQKTENNFNALKAGIDLEIEQVAATYLNAAETAESQKENAKLAENIAKVTRIKFEQGVGSNLEVVEAESALREAQVNYYNALYDAIVAKIDLDKAYGKLGTQTSDSK
jgi:outer membrane protein